MRGRLALTCSCSLTRSRSCEDNLYTLEYLTALSKRVAVADSASEAMEASENVVGEVLALPPIEVEAARPAKKAAPALKPRRKRTKPDEEPAAAEADG